MIAVMALPSVVSEVRVNDGNNVPDVSCSPQNEHVCPIARLWMHSASAGVTPMLQFTSARLVPPLPAQEILPSATCSAHAASSVSSVPSMLTSPACWPVKYHVGPICPP